MSVVSNIVTEVVREKHGTVSLGAYQPTVDAVIERIESALENAVDTLKARAQREGLRMSMVEQALVEAGLVEPEPEPEVVEPTEAQPEWATRLIERFDRIEAEARRRGLLI